MYSNRLRQFVLVSRLTVICVFAFIESGSCEELSLADISKDVHSRVESISEFGYVVSITRKGHLEESELHRLMGKGASGGTYSEEFAMKGKKRFIEVKSSGSRSSVLQRPEIDPLSSPQAQANVKARQDQYDRTIKTIKDSVERNPSGPTFEERMAMSRQRAIEKAATITTKAYNGSVVRELRAGEKKGSIYRPSEPSTQVFQTLYLTMIGLFLDDDLYSPEVRECCASGLLPGTLDQGTYTISWETKNGLECLKLVGTTCVACPESIHDTLWLSKAHGWMIVQRESRELGSMRLKQRIFASEFKEVLPRVWMPRICVFEEFPRTIDTKSTEAKALISTTLEITQFEMKIEDAKFELGFPAGTMLTDKATPQEMGIDKWLHYKMPADRSKLDDVIREASLEKSVLSSTKTSTGLRLLVITTLLLLGIGLGAILIKRRK